MSENQEFRDDRYFVVAHNKGANPTTEPVQMCYGLGQAAKTRYYFKDVLKYDYAFVYHSPGAMVPTKEGYQPYGTPRESVETPVLMLPEEEDPLAWNAE